MTTTSLKQQPGNPLTWRDLSIGALLIVAIIAAGLIAGTDPGAREAGPWITLSGAALLVWSLLLPRWLEDIKAARASSTRATAKKRAPKNPAPVKTRAEAWAEKTTMRGHVGMLSAALILFGSAITIIPHTDERPLVEQLCSELSPHQRARLALHHPGRITAAGVPSTRQT